MDVLSPLLDKFALDPILVAQAAALVVFLVQFIKTRVVPLAGDEAAMEGNVTLIVTLVLSAGASYLWFGEAGWGSVIAGAGMIFVAAILGKTISFGRNTEKRKSILDIRKGNKE